MAHGRVRDLEDGEGKVGRVDAREAVDRGIRGMGRRGLPVSWLRYEEVVVGARKVVCLAVAGRSAFRMGFTSPGRVSACCGSDVTGDRECGGLSCGEKWVKFRVRDVEGNVVLFCFGAGGLALWRRVGGPSGLCDCSVLWCVEVLGQEFQSLVEGTLVWGCCAAAEIQSSNR